MTRRPKDIGTEGEGAARTYLRRWFPKVDRPALHGSKDIGDLLNTGRVCFEVKWGKAAETAGPELIESWLGQTEVERRHAGAAFGVLIVKRKGYGVARFGQQWAYVSTHDVCELLDGGTYLHPDAPEPYARMTVADVMALLEWAGETDTTDDDTAFTDEELAA